ncbi:ferritin-like domain-containing protein [Hymenobacter persicinus]|uniref:Ferritin-like domain-containing protein n=1 Tax=Hymenobacter persicinus TaxID=2025506 RepID=A0A4Q5L9S1_9BACT|nr:ferritin-like domain-containing protein [Hymenobacter persicinus]RYU78526.1 ferritin-like domain-containing protein [Hymenobacter persicinus]
MNLFNLLSDIEAVDPEVYARFDGRRRVFQHLGTVGRRLTAAAVPGALSALFSRAYGQGTGLPADVANVLNLALQLEYLEYSFYSLALSSPLPLTAEDRAAVTLLRNDENNHVQTLRTVLGTAAIAPLPFSAFDFTGSKGGRQAPAFPTVFSNPYLFLSLAQCFEDLGVRAYKGALPTLFVNKLVTEAALSIHSVEARHASHVRTMRRGGAQSLPGSPVSAPKSWITGSETGGPLPNLLGNVYFSGTPTNLYPSEDNTVQSGINLLSAFPGVATAALASEAFDEPLDAVSVSLLMGYFRV